MESNKLLLKAIHRTAQMIRFDHVSARTQPEAGLGAAPRVRRGRIVASTNSNTLHHNRRASRRMASGATGLSRHFETPKSSVSGTQYLRHAASSFLTLLRIDLAVSSEATAHECERVAQGWGEGEQVEVEGSVLRCEKAEKGSNIGWHVETLRVHPKSCTQGVEVLKTTTAARISHGVSSAKDMADMEPRLLIEKGRHCMQVLKRTLRRIVLCFVICQVESRRKRV
eukprot:2249194-Pleurochrysis_carterae.AAC.10